MACEVAGQGVVEAFERLEPVRLQLADLEREAILRTLEAVGARFLHLS
jgi:hypothetical protein